MDDGETPEPVLKNSTLHVEVHSKKNKGRLDLTMVKGSTYQPPKPLTNVVVLNVPHKPTKVSLGKDQAKFEYDESRKLLNVTGIEYTFPLQKKSVTLNWA